MTQGEIEKLTAKTENIFSELVSKKTEFLQHLQTGS